MCTHVCADYILLSQPVYLCETSGILYVPGECVKDRTACQWSHLQMPNDNMTLNPELYKSPGSIRICHFCKCSFPSFEIMN